MTEWDCEWARGKDIRWVGFRLPDPPRLITTSGVTVEGSGDVVEEKEAAGDTGLTDFGGLASMVIDPLLL